MIFLCDLFVWLTTMTYKATGALNCCEPIYWYASIFARILAETCILTNSRVCVITGTNRCRSEWNSMFTCIWVALTVSTTGTSNAVQQNTIEHIIISEAVYTGWHSTTWQIPESKLMPRSINDVLTQSSNDLQRSLCRVQCRQTLAVGARPV